MEPVDFNLDFDKPRVDIEPWEMQGEEDERMCSGDGYEAPDEEDENEAPETGDLLLSRMSPAPEDPAIHVNVVCEPQIYGLPPAVQDFITDVCEKKQVPVEFVLSPLLAVAGTLAGLYAILDGRGYENSPCFWCMVIGDAGSNKSYPQALVTRPLARINATLAKKHKEDLAQWQKECSKIKDKRRLPPQPPKCRVSVGDATREALAEVLAGSPCGVCQIRDELSGWLADIGRYGKSGEVQTYLSYWNGLGASIDRKGEPGTTVVEQVLFNICGTTQPDILPDCFPKQYIDNGFIYRFMFFWPQDIPAKKIEREPQKPDTAQWERIVKNLYKGRIKTTRLTLGEEANTLAMEYEQEIEDRKAFPDISQYEAGALSKLSITMLRLADIARMLAIADGDASTEITGTEMRWAIDLCRYLHQTQMRVYEVLTAGKRRAAAPPSDAELVREFYSRYKGKGLTQGKLAKALGVSQSYISQCVNPKAKPTEATEETK